MEPSNPLNGLTGPDIDKPSCQLLGPTALIVQGLMGIMVVLSLVLKRHRESPKRPWRIWLFDVSKQVAGQLFVHLANLLVSGITSQHTFSNACISYFCNILIDTTLGVALIYFTLHALTNVLTDRLHVKGLESGVYGDPPSLTYWLRQAGVYILALSTMKVVVVTLLFVFPVIYKLGEWLLSWTWLGGSDDDFQVIFVMGIFPILMNIIQFWLIDSIVKASSVAGVALDIENDAGATQPLFQADDQDDDDRTAAQQHSRRRPSLSSYDSATYHSSDDITPDTVTGATTPDEQKLPKLVESHGYPPSLSSSMSSNASTSQDKPPRIAKNLMKKTKRKDTPPSTDGPSTPSSSATVRQGSPPARGSVPPTAVHTSQQSAEWGTNWDDANEWERRPSIGENDRQSHARHIHLQT